MFRIVVYNGKHRYNLSYYQMELLLSDSLPEMEDVLFVLFYIINLHLGLVVFWTRCTLASKHIRLCVITIFETNLVFASLLILYALLIAQFSNFPCLILSKDFCSYLFCVSHTVSRFILSSRIVSFVFLLFQQPFVFERFFVSFFLAGFLLGNFYNFIFGFLIDLFNYFTN